MRLTLRTLLAWLDDTLPAEEVRQIGQQVAESSFAQELVDRTYRVTRQRRLLVPASTGPDAIDPNLVSAYLDNELEPAEVGEYEKRCLTSDVNLAEVASVHQILSLIGQKAKVPPESRHRMYRLAKGREAVNNKSARAFQPRPRREAAPRVASWTPQTTIPRRPLGERLGIASLVVVLLAVIGWTAVNSLRQDTSTDPNRPLFRFRNTKADPVAGPLESKRDGQGDVTPKAASSAIAANAVSNLMKPPERLDIPKAEADTNSAAAASAAITLVKGDGVVLGWDRDKNEWKRLLATAPIKDATRLLNLSPFWTTLQAGPAQVVLVGDTETTVAGGAARGGVKLGFNHGRAILKGAEVGNPCTIDLSGRGLAIANAPGASIGIERTWTPPPGGDASTSGLLLVYVPEGEATLQIGETKETVRGPAVVSMGENGPLQPLRGIAIPPWVAETGPSPADKQLGDRFLKFFSPSGSVLRDLVQAVDGDDQDVRRLAIRGLGGVGDAEMIVPVMNNTQTDAPTRRAAADVLRTMLARGGDTAKRVRDEIVKVFGQEWANPTEKLLNGYTSDKEKREANVTELVTLLNAPELGKRELAIQALMAITKRDNLEYDPVKPEGRGLRAWQDLLHKKELVKPSAPAINP